VLRPADEPNAGVSLAWGEAYFVVQAPAFLFSQLTLRQAPRGASRIALFLALVVLFLLLRLTRVEADPPIVHPDGRQAYELRVEGIAKAHEARNAAAFGSFQTNPVDNYQFWRAQSPVWVYPLSWFFKVFGVGYAQLRTFSVLGSLLGLVGLVAFASLRLGPTWAALAGLIALLNSYEIFFARSALLEPTVNSWMTLTALCCVLAFRQHYWAIAAQVCLVATILTKQTGLVLVPLVFGATVLSVVSAHRRGAAWSWAALASFVVAAGSLFAYSRTPAYMRALSWNWGHIVLRKTQVKEVDVSELRPMALAERFLDTDRLKILTLYVFPGAFLFVLIALVFAIFRARRERRPTPWDAVLFAWLLSALGAVMVTEQLERRFFLIVLPPLALIAASALHDLYELLRTRGQAVLLSYAATALVVGSILLTHGKWYLKWYREPTYVTRDTNAWVRQKIGERPAVLVGFWAGPFVFDTPFVYYYVKEYFNTERRAIKQLGITHVLYREPRGMTESVLDRRFPNWKKRARLLGTRRVWGRNRLVLYELTEPLG
jgi:4-amino-4-deoxy-L-arabinose transferase-like glycosyltransferase